MNFTPQQQHSLLSKMGYNGPVDSNMMDAFLSSNPGAAVKMGKFDRVMKRGFSAGGSVDNRVRQAYRNIFGRDPKAEGFEYWKNVVQNNPNFDLEAEFRKSPEYQARSVYQELLGRQPGMGAIENFINSGTTADQLRTQILASPEYQAKQNQTTVTTPPVTTPPVTTPPVTTPTVTTPTVTTPTVTTPTVTTPTGGTTGGSVDDRVRQAYQDTFGRDPKTEGFEFWKNALIQNPNLDLEAEFRKSPEYEARGVYEELLGRQPGIETVENFINTGTTADQLRTQILASPEYQVRQAYESVFGKTPDEEGLQYWMDAFSQNPNLDLQAELRDSEEYRALGVDELEERRDRYTATRSPLDLSRLQEGLPSTVELAATALVDPMSRVTQATPPQMTVEEGQLVDPSVGVPTAPVGQAETTTVGTTSQAATPEALTAAQMTAKTVSPAVKGEMDKLQPVQGTVSDQAQVTAEQQTESSVSNLQAAQGEAIMMDNPVQREIQEGELISGSAVDATKVEEMNAQLQAAQATPSEKATVQGQLEDLMQQFEGGNTPAWAAGAMRNANAMLAQRGLGASSMAGQAVIQAAMESALPIAQADANTRAQFESQNLSNRQQVAMFAAEQRAAFLKQEFDQEFQARVQNSARIADIANMNFTAEQQVALENSRAANTMNLSNLSNRQAMVMAEASALANLDLANLNNRQQAAVHNAKAFLEMDMANLNNQQQTAIFKSQQIVNSMLSDQAAENAAAQFNAASENQTNQFFADLQSTVSRFNADQMNGVAKFNAGEENATARFNESLAEQRQQFETSNRLIVAQANAKWRQDIATANTAMENEALMESVKAANSMTTTAIDNMWQRERDLMDFAYRSSESAMDRNLNILLADKNMDLFRERLDAQADMTKGAALGDLFSDLIFG